MYTSGDYYMLEYYFSTSNINIIDVLQYKIYNDDQIINYLLEILYLYKVNYKISKP